MNMQATTITGQRIGDIYIVYDRANAAARNLVWEMAIDRAMMPEPKMKPPCDGWISVEDALPDFGHRVIVGSQKSASQFGWRTKTRINPIAHQRPTSVSRG